MSDNRTALESRTDSGDSLGELLRSRALASSPRLLIGQAVAGVALNASVIVWHPERWGIATAAVATLALHALWSVAVQRTTADDEPLGHGDDALVVHADHTDHTLREESPHRERRGWWRVRRASAIVASACALLLLWFVCMMLLGRLMS